MRLSQSLVGIFSVLLSVNAFEVPLRVEDPDVVSQLSSETVKAEAQEKFEGHHAMHMSHHGSMTHSHMAEHHVAEHHASAMHEHERVVTREHNIGADREHRAFRSGADEEAKVSHRRKAGFFGWLFGGSGSKDDDDDDGSSASAEVVSGFRNFFRGVLRGGEGNRTAGGGDDRLMYT
uniref:Uncharacterized protein n=1 Tax=Chromera velia CCMP2878 TaxID=1169474 RepID=A0A0G4GUU1_9ALVE|eukprot:Cvel_23468.t1-p1 / transcript=Cvel_23468.t1 / gene=Cvel_23468 / organism=Chromera_velia_CCMP2878 / gene_product=hypothetical protein / transcript_product=hypothetical protein / location=Cvel_scaffold2421:17297-18115(+) / protein_length=176 / sequence_SO=supercontig / SO=protein_coding / is_pseudo=false